MWPGSTLSSLCTDQSPCYASHQRYCWAASLTEGSQQGSGLAPWGRAAGRGRCAGEEAMHWWGPCHWATSCSSPHTPYTAFLGTFVLHCKDTGSFGGKSQFQDQPRWRQLLLVVWEITEFLDTSTVSWSFSLKIKAISFFFFFHFFLKITTHISRRNIGPMCLFT